MGFLDRYSLDSVLAERGAVVTRAMRAADGARVVVKTLSVRGTRDAREIGLFEREAGILKHLSHKAVPRFVDYAVEDGDGGGGGGDVRLHLVQSFVEGRSLDGWIREGRSFSEREAIEILRALADVLIALHGTSPALVHRDIKPGNVMRNDAGEIFLVDFGAAKRAARDGTAVGTFGYMAPEQMEGRASPASDVFGVGMTLVHVLTHQEPEAFADEGGVRKAWRKHANVTDDLAALIDDCIALEDTARPRDGAALRARIDALGAARPRPVPAVPPRRNATGAIAAAAAVALTVLGMGVAFFVFTPADVTSNPQPVVPIDEPLAPAPPRAPVPGPLTHQKIPPSVRLGVPGLFETISCMSRAERALSSEDRYRSWRAGDAAPTCAEPYVGYGLYTLYDDAPSRCETAATAATAHAPTRAATAELAAALTALTPTVAEAASYYDAEDYKDDACARGKALHLKLLPQFARARAAFAATLEARRALVQAPPPDDELMRPYRDAIDAALAVADPALPLSGRRDAVLAYEKAVAACPKPLNAIAVNVDSLKKWARGSNAIGASMSVGSIGWSTASAIEMRLLFE